VTPHRTIRPGAAVARSVCGSSLPGQPIRRADGSVPLRHSTGRAVRVLWRAGAAIWRAALTLGACALAGCSGGLHSNAPATQVYVLRAAPHSQPAAKPPTASLHINRPLAAPGLESDHIVLVQPDHKMSYYIASRWPGDLSSVVEALTVDTLRTTGDWTSVQDSGSVFSSDYMLQIVIRRFEADYSAGTVPEVHVVLDCIVGRRAGREVIGSFVAEGSATASANRLGPVVGAFEEAANHALADIAARTAQAVQKP
jgi:cholesterol transport system auxiliary component